MDNIKKWFWGIILGAFSIIVLCSSIYKIDPGEVGVVITLGKISKTPSTNGLGFKWPFISKVVRLNIKTSKIENVVATYTKDIQQAGISYVFTYNLNGSAANNLYSDVGLDYEIKVINPIIIGSIKDIIGQWQAQDLVSNREVAKDNILEAINNKLLDMTYFLNFDFQIINIDYSDIFEKSIENKVIAEQEALRAINNTRKVEEESKQLVIKAEADATSIEIRAKALEKNKNLIEYEAIQRWDGQLPTYMMGNSVPFINLK